MGYAGSKHHLDTDIKGFESSHFVRDKDEVVRKELPLRMPTVHAEIADALSRDA